MSEKEFPAPERVGPPHGLGAALAVAVVGAAFSFGVGLHGRRQERAQIRAEFSAAAQNHAASVRRSTDLARLLVSAGRSWHSVSDRRDAEDFRVFTTPLLRDLRGVRGLEWVPRVVAAEREAFEESMRASGVSGFVVTERDAEGRMVPAGARPEYFPVSDVEPGSDPSPVVGFDLASEPVRYEAMRRAVQSGRTAATGRLSLVETRGQYGFLMVCPVFRDAAGPPSLAERQQRLEGFVIGVFRIADLVEDALSSLQPLEIDVEIRDESAAVEDQLLYARSAAGAEPAQLPEEGGLRQATRMNVGGRSWAVHSSMRPEFVSARETGNPLRLLLGGLLLTSLVVAGLVANARKARALQLANTRLLTASADRERAIEALRLSEARHREVVEEQAELILRWSPDGTLTFANHSLASFLGCTPEELAGAPLSRAVGTAAAAALVAGLPGAFLPVPDLQLSLSGVADRVGWYSWTRRPLFDEEGRITEVQAVGRDVTELKRAQDDLREQEERFRHLTEAAFEGILLSRDGVVLDANPRMAEMLGYDGPTELLGRPLLDLVAPESREELNGRVRARDDGPYEIVARTRGGHRFPVEVRARSTQIGGREVRIGAITDITERKQAQARLLEQEERFRRLAEAAFEGIAVTYKGTIIDANAQLARMLGYDPGELLGKEAESLVAPESRELVAERMRSGSEGPYEHLALSRDGRVVPVEVRARMIPVAGRQVRISAIRDVTDQKRAQLELASSRAFLDTIFTGLDLAVWVVDVSERGELSVAACNPAWEALVGMESNAVVGRGFDHLAGRFPPEMVAEEEAAIRRCVEARHPVREEARDGLLAGVEGDFLRQLNPLQTPEGRVYRVIATTIGVTDLRRAERTLRAGQHLMAEAERIARLGSWEAELSTGRLRVSDEVWRIAGEPADVPVDAWSWDALMGLVPPEDGVRLREAIERLQAGQGLDGLEHRFLRPDGELAHVVVNAEIERDASGRPVRAVGSVQDVTERKRAEEAAERQREELIRADKMIALGTLLSGVAHEINNPNHFILLNLQLLRSAWKDAAPALDAHAASDPEFALANLPYSEMRTEVPALIDEVIDGAERIRFIVSELRGYAGGQSDSAGPVSLNDAVRSALTLIASPIKKATRRFSVHYGAELPGVRGNVRRLEQVVINLILNACQALPDPQRAIRVETSHDAAEDQVVVTVADEGCGIAEADLKRITDPFFTTKREKGGTGLGLSVSARIVEEHGGRLTFESESGRGTVARVSLPVEPGVGP